MTYRETLDYLYAQLPMYHRIGPAAFKKDLTNTLALCEHLGNPQQRFKSVHVGGTNGKGSVSHMLAAVCQAAGLKTGLYISPHYKDFRERIKVDGQYIPRRQVIDFVAQNREAIAQIQPSFFELCVAMAFDHFARAGVDVAIIEVGLGGRLDSTNVITPLLSVITNISYDHQSMLGDTLPQIAFEKAGIIKPGVPVVIGETHPESAPVFIQKAAETGSEIVFADRQFAVTEIPAGDGLSSVYEVNGQTFELDAGGPYQAKNLATLLQSVEILRRFLPRIKPGTVQHGLKNLRTLTRFIGRWQIIGQNPTILCDSAHNEAGLQLAFERIRQILAIPNPQSPIRNPQSPIPNPQSPIPPSDHRFCERQGRGQSVGVVSAGGAVLFCQSRHPPRTGGRRFERKSRGARPEWTGLYLGAQCPQGRPPYRRTQRPDRGDRQHFRGGRGAVTLPNGNKMTPISIFPYPTKPAAASLRAAKFPAPSI